MELTANEPVLEAQSVASILDAEQLIQSDQRITNFLKEIDFNKFDIMEEFKHDRNILESLVSMSKFSLTWMVKQIFKQPDGRPLELLPFQSCQLDMMFNYKYPMILASRGAGKTFMYGLYALLRAILIPGQQIVIVGAGFRQAKLVFNYITKLYQSSPLLQEALRYAGLS